MWPWRSWTAAIASSEATRSSSVSPIPTRMPLVNGICSSPAASIVSRRRAGCLVGEPAWTVSISRSEIDSSISPCEAVTSRSRARSSGESTPEVGVRQDAALERALAGPDDVGGEVLVAPRAQPLGDHRVDLGPLAGQHQQLLGVAPRGLLEPALDLIRVVDVRLVRGEGAVLAEALAGARQGERVVAREGDALHRGPYSRARCPWRPGAQVDEEGEDHEEPLEALDAVGAPGPEGRVGEGRPRQQEEARARGRSSRRRRAPGRR